MNIIKSMPNESGAYPPIQSWSGETPPEGYYEAANGVALSCGGFGALTIVNDVVTEFTPNETAWNAWKAANPEPTPQPTAEEKLAKLEADNATMSADIMSFMELYFSKNPE